MDESNADIPESFWQLIELARRDEKLYQRKLRELDREALVDVYWTYERAAATLKDVPYVDYVRPGLSEDGVDDIAQWVVAQGKDYYMNVLRHPEQIPEEVEDPTGLLGDIAIAHRERFGGPVPLRED